MIHGMWVLARHDLLVWRRTPRAVISALIPPLGMGLLLIVLTFSVGKQPVALVVQSQGQSAQDMAQIIEADREAYALTVTNARTALTLLQNQQVAAVIVIPPHFDLAVRSHVATLDLTLNNVDIDFADDIRRTVARSVAEFDAPQLGIQGEIGGPSEGVTLPNPYRISIDEHNLRNTNVNFLRYQVLPALILLVLSIGLMGTALLCAYDVEQSTVRHLVLSPLSTWSLVAGRLFGGLLASLIALLPVLAVCAITGVVSPPPGHWPVLLALFVTTGLAASGLGAALGASIRGAQTVAMASSVLATYLFFLGGGFTTIAFLPAWLQTLSGLIPTRYAIDGLREILFYPELTGVSTDLLVLGGTALVAVALGTAAVRRSWSM
jgi:ABC-2 type transport system permease protein